MSGAADPILGPWTGPFGGVPELDRFTADQIEQAVLTAIREKRARIEAIAANPEPPTFANTVEALEEAGDRLRNAQAVLQLMMSTASIGSLPEISRRLVAAIAQFDDEIALNDALFARIEAVHETSSDLEPVQKRLVEVLHDSLKRRGAGLPAERRGRLMEVNGAIAESQTRFQQNELAESERLLWVEDEAALEGIPPATTEAAAQLAARNERPGSWAFANIRPVVWAILQHGRNRALRKRARDMWVGRNAHGDEYDNHQLARDIVSLRGEKARLLGFESFAHLATSPQMAGTPERALGQMRSVWHPAKRDALRLIEELQAIADADALGGRIEAHDYLFYAERRREQRFSFDAQQVREYLTIDTVTAAMFDAASRLYGLSFRRARDVPVIHPDVQVVEVSRDGELVGLLMLDLVARTGKMPSAWQQELQRAQTYRGRRPTISLICANIERSSDGAPALMPWEIANVFFHEFGHALHMLLSRAPYPSLGSVTIAWDAIELPSQLNERWLYDRDLLRKHMRHWKTGEPMPDRLIDALIAVRDDERVVSVTLGYLGPAIVDMEMYLAASGDPVDPFAIEQRVMDELQMPSAIDPIMRLPHQHHSFTDSYAALLYSYLWADVLVAEVLEAFADAPGRLYDRDVADRFRETVLSAANTAPAEQSFRNFRGRDPDPKSLIRRFGLEAA